MSIDDVARETDISTATVQRYETERGAVKVAYIRVLLGLYEASTRRRRNQSAVCRPPGTSLVIRLM